MDELRRLLALRARGTVIASTCVEVPPAKGHNNAFRITGTWTTSSMTKVIGKPAATALALVRRRKPPPAKLYDDTDDEEVEEVASPQPEAPLTELELKQYDAQEKSSRSEPGQRSHLKKIVKILRRQEPARWLGASAEEILEKGFDVKGIRVVAATLQREKLGSGPNYISTWRMTRAQPPTGPEDRKSRLAMRVLRRFGKRPQQAAELDAELLRKAPLRRAPLCRGGGVWPYQAAHAQTTMMLRGIEARSLRNWQVARGDRWITMKFRTRKSNQYGVPRDVHVECMCEATPHCIHCSLAKYMVLAGARSPKGYFFAGVGGRPVTARGHGDTMKAIAVALKMKVTGRPKGHSPRVTGAKLWSRLGLRRETIGSLGGWRCMKTLERYIGTAGLNQRMREELKEVGSRPGATNHMSLETVMNTALQVYHAQPKEALAAQLSIVTNRRPRRYHKIVSLSGRSSHWHTACGDRFNPLTMVLQPTSEFDAVNEKMCTQCYGENG